MNLAAIVPVYNEESTIASVIDDIRENSDVDVIIVVDDGSTDQTHSICDSMDVDVVGLSINQGIRKAVQAGMLRALERGCDACIQIDADGQHDASQISILVNAFNETNPDIVIGSRYLRCDSRENNLAKRIAKAMIASKMRRSGVDLTDPTSGMRMYSQSLMQRFANTEADGPEADTVFAELLSGASYIEVGIEVRNRIQGQSSLHGLPGVRYTLNMLKAIGNISRECKSKSREYLI